MRRLVGIPAIIAAAGCATTSGAGGPSLDRGDRVVQLTLAAPDGLTCEGYLVRGREPVTDVFLWMGGTGTGSIAFLPDEARELLAARSAAFITFDKPGVHARFGDPASVTIDDGPFMRHTQGTLLGCAERAVDAAVATFGPSVRLHFRGHSEGALIALDLLDALLGTNPERARMVRTLILSGLPFEPMDEIVRRQLADKPVLARAVAGCDQAVMRRELGVSCAYLADAGRRPAGRVLFEHLALARPDVAIRIFQGETDRNTPASFVRRLAEWNASTGHLDLIVRFYQGDHHGSAAVRKELADLLLALVPPAGSR